jgi:hypothetical protein
VGPILDKFELGGVPYEGQYIAAGFSGHGMPRAFGWLVQSFLFIYCTRMTRHRSADIVARMIASKIRGQEWELPPWLPLHYLTNLPKRFQSSHNPE